MADTKPRNGPPSLADVRAHAQQLEQDLIQKAPTGANALADMVPDFSRGTSAVDAETGAPLLSGQTVTLSGEEAQGVPEGGPLQSSANADALAQAAAEAAQAGGGATERDSKGRFVSDKPQDAAPTAQQPPQEQAQQQAPAPTGAAAAEAAAANMLNRDDYDEIEYEDSDTGEKLTVYAKKDHAGKVKNGYLRRSVMDRNSRYLSEAKPVLEPLIVDGRMRDILPLIQQAVGDPEFGQYVVEAYNRRVTGQPLYQQTQTTPPPAQAAPAAQQGAPDQFALDEAQDPYMADIVGRYVKPLAQEFQATKQELEAFRSQQAQEAQRRQDVERQQQQAIQTMQQAHAELHRIYPNEFTGDVMRDDSLLKDAARYARESGAIQYYGMSPLTIVYAYERLRESRAAAAASPAAAAIAQASTAEAAIAQRNAQAAAAAVSAGAPATNTTRRQPPPAPKTRDANGRPVPLTDYARQQLARIQAMQK